MSYRESDGSIWEGAKPNEGYFACDTCGTTHFRLKDTILDAGQISRIEYVCENGHRVICTMHRKRKDKAN